jgi:broad specificity phosphatase PhoE
MPKPRTVWLIRHGQSAANAGLATSDPRSIPLTELGHAQARQAAEQIDRQPDTIVVSPFLRARETAAPIEQAWPGAPVLTWPIHEFTYLSPAKYAGLTVYERRPLANAYWQRADPAYCDGIDAESFESFAARLRDFHRRLQELDGFVVAVGHGQFFYAYKLALELGLRITADWMRNYRERELATPLGNGEIVPVSPAGVVLD